MAEKEKLDFQDLAELEIKSLKKEIGSLSAENDKLKQVIEDNDLSELIPDINCISVEEKLCMNGIRQISAKVEACDFEKKDVESFEKLFNVLMAIRGKAGSGNKRVKDKDVVKLLQIVGEGH